ncbi:MAG: YidC/Oxa1 family membrane protein insertase [Clostridia bacterium]|nr:YidC/Oxa1 family membrane protein insertase [Clostridia bacterium]
MKIITWPFAKLLELFNFTGSYAVALLFFAIVVKLVTLPFSIKQQKTQIKAAKLRPKMAAIEKKYAGRTDKKTLDKKQKELMELQQNEGYSPLSGCLPMLIQFPIIIILYQLIQNPLTYVCGMEDATVNAIIAQLHTLLPEVSTSSFTQLNVLQYAHELTEAGHTILHWDAMQSINLGFFGAYLGTTPTITSWYAFFPVATAVFSYLSMKLTRKFMGNNPALQAQTPETKTSGIIMDLMMPLMSLWIAFKLPALLSLYWVYQSILGVAQQAILSYAMPLPKYTDEEIRAILKAEKERAAANRAAMRSGEVSAKSLHHIDDDDDEDVYVPPIRSKFDEDEDAPSAPIAPAPVKPQGANQTHKRQTKKKK